MSRELSLNSTFSSGIGLVAHQELYSLWVDQPLNSLLLSQHITFQSEPYNQIWWKLWFEMVRAFSQEKLRYFSHLSDTGIGYFVCNTCLTLTNLVIIKTADVKWSLNTSYTNADRQLAALHEPFFHPVSFAIVSDKSALFWLCMPQSAMHPAEHALHTLAPSSARCHICVSRFSFDHRVQYCPLHRNLRKSTTTQLLAFVRH